MINARLEELRTKFQENPRRYFAPFANELRKTGDAAQAIAICRAHLAGQPGHVSGHIVLGQALYEAGQAAEAREVFAAALELDPENLIALRSMGEIAQVNGEFGTARHWYERLLDADPRNTDVVQLLKDIPVQAPADEPTLSAPPAQAEPPAAEEPAAEQERQESGPSAPTFHTNYTGAAPAWEPREKFEVAAEPAEDLIDIASMPQSEPAPISMEPLDAVPADAESPASDALLDMVDMGSFPSHSGYDEPAAVVLPDEDLMAPAMESEPVAADELPVAKPEPAAELPLASSEAPAESLEQPPGHDVVAEADEVSFDPPRALFAEHGFEGGVDDQVGWITPSAAYSDPEAAPEDWFNEPAAEPAANTQPEPSTMEEAAAEPQPAEEPAHDSWFDEVDLSSSTEPAEASSEELWMPDFRGVGGTEPDASTPDWPMGEQEYVPSSDAGDDAQPVAASASEVPDEFEPPRVEVEAMSDAAEDAVMIEYPPAPEASRADEMLREPDFISYTSDLDVAAAAEPPDEELARSASAEYPDPAVGHTPSFNSTIPSSQAAPAPFVTETLAELYLQQGFREEAVAIYKQLADRDPSDQSLRLRIESIERGDASDVMQTADVSGTRRAPSVRSFFSKLAHRAPVSYVNVAAQQPAAPSSSESSFAAAASALANLFAASRPTQADEGAASKLASAFTDPAGRPSRAADRELSLDHLFRDVPSGGQGAGAGGVMLDEFYATSIPPAEPDSSTPSGEAAAPDEGGTDIRQFTAWLEGLRKK